MQLFTLTIILVHIYTYATTLYSFTLVTINSSYILYDNTLWHTYGTMPCTSIPHAFIISNQSKTSSTFSLIDSLDWNAWLKHLLRLANLSRHEHSHSVGSQTSSWVQNHVVCMCVFPFFFVSYCEYISSISFRLNEFF